MDTKTLVEEVIKNTKIEQQQEYLKKLGFDKAAGELKEGVELKRKLAIACEHYRIVTPKHIQEFNERLRKATYANGSWKQVTLTPIQNYDKVPPKEVLLELEKAQERKCFDKYEVAYITEVKDPILFGRINKCENLFYIAQWDDDISINDLLKENEG